MSRRLLTAARLWITILWVSTLVLASAACGDDPGVGDPPDAGADPARRLVVLAPGESVGILFGGEATLRVRLEDIDGFAVPNAPVEFEFFVTATESTGGAALSNRSAITDDTGIARVTVSAGAERANFRVRANAENATPVLFFVAVSELGFADLEVTPQHLGFRDAEAFARVELRLYRHGILRCDQINPDFPPDTVFPVKSLPGFGGAVTFDAVSAFEPYTLLAWGEIGQRGTPVAIGCATLGGQQVQPAPRVSMDIVVEDRALVLPSTADLVSTLDLAPVADAAQSTAWDLLACPAGPGQVIIDHILVADGSDTLAADIGPLRGAIDGDTGCRASVDSEGGASIDIALTNAVGAGADFPTGDDFADLVALRRAIATSVSLSSTITSVGPGVARHALRSARFGTESTFHDIDLAGSARPVLAATQIPVAVADGIHLAIGAHAFTLRLGPASRQAFTALALQPQSLNPATVGTSMVASVGAGPATGCTAVSNLVCTAIAAPTNCVATACTEAVPALNAELDSWWQIYPTTGLDFSLAGAATLHDFDGDLQVDSVGTNNTAELATWTATVSTTTGPIEVTGTFASAPPVAK